MLTGKAISTDPNPIDYYQRAHPQPRVALWMATGEAMK